MGGLGCTGAALNDAGGARHPLDPPLGEMRARFAEELPIGCSRVVWGKMQAFDPVVPRPKSRKIYILLAAVAGTLGIHNFYARRWLAGWIQLALGGFSLAVGMNGLRNFLNQFQSGTLDLSDPEAMQAFFSTVFQGVGWVATASTAAFVIVGVWVLLDIFAVKQDGAGNPLE